MREWNCETDGQLAQKAVAAKLEGKVVAVDVSLWTCQALMQGALVEVFPDEEARVVKVAFDRVSHPNLFGASGICSTACNLCMLLSAYGESITSQPPM